MAQTSGLSQVPCHSVMYIHTRQFTQVYYAIARNFPAIICWCVCRWGVPHTSKTIC